MSLKSEELHQGVAGPLTTLRHRLFTGSQRLSGMAMMIREIFELMDWAKLISPSLQLLVRGLP